MSDHSEPRWELLPHDAEQFFGLSGEFDLRDLKRSYNRLIRRFKPEKFPDEFQRIRAAYESLSDALRYNLPTRRPIATQWPLSLDDIVADRTPDESVAVPATVVDQPPLCHERVASDNPADLYAELKAKPTKMPNDFAALALLADVVVQENSMGAASESFVDWLFTGLADHSQDWGLTELLREYLCEEHSLDHLSALLLRAVEVLLPERFQYATERAWDRLLREASFEQFRDCLERCGAKLGKSVDHSQLVFYVHVLKLALWKADDDFIEEIRATVDDHYESLSYWAQEEYDLISSLLDYRSHREEFMLRGASCRRIDQAIRDWSVLPETEGDLSVLDCQYFLSMQGQRLLDEFPDWTDDVSYMLLPWDRIVSDVLDRLGEPEPQDDATLAQHTHNFMIRMMRRFKRTLRYFTGLTMVLGAIAMLLVVGVTSGSLAIRLFMKLAAGGQLLSASLDGLAAAAVLVIGFIAAVAVFFFGRRYSTLRYESVRRELFKLVRVTALRVDELAEFIAAREDEKYGDDNTIDDTDVITKRIGLDAGVELFSLAQVCLSAAAPEPVVEATVIEPVVNENRAPRKPVARRIT